MTKTVVHLIFDEEPVSAILSGFNTAKLPLSDYGNPDSSCTTALNRSQPQNRYLIIEHLHTWLKLRQDAQNYLKAITDHHSLNNSTLISEPNADDRQMEPFKYFTETRDTWSSSESLDDLSAKKDDRAPVSVNVIVYRIALARKPYFTWSTELCNSLILAKLAQSAKLEYLKAVNSTLGGAYSTLQRAGWARLFAKKTLRLALASGDQTLALRAKVYLKICKITAILHPSHASRKIYADDLKGVTTKTDTNVHHSDAKLIPDHLRANLKADLALLASQAEIVGDESVSGLIEYAAFRIDTH